MLATKSKRKHITRAPSGKVGAKFIELFEEGCSLSFPGLCGEDRGGGWEVLVEISIVKFNLATCGYASSRALARALSIRSGQFVWQREHYDVYGVAV